MKYFNRHVYVQARKPEPVTVSIVEVEVGVLIGRGLGDEEIERAIPGISGGTIREIRRTLKTARRTWARGAQP